MRTLDPEHALAGEEGGERCADAAVVVPDGVGAEGEDEGGGGGADRVGDCR
jgi:hypothetical protein